MSRRWWGNDLQTQWDREAAGQMYYQNGPSQFERTFDVGIDLSRYKHESQYLKADEVVAKKGLGWSCIVEISSVQEEQMPDLQAGNPTQKVVVYFRQFKKGLVLNQGNLAFLCETFGEDTDQWPGKRCLFVVEQVLMAGKAVPGMRLRTDVTPDPDGGAGDEIPF